MSLESKRRQKQIQDNIDKYNLALEELRNKEEFGDERSLKELELTLNIVKYLSQFVSGEDEFAFDARGDILENFLMSYYERLSLCPSLRENVMFWDMWLLFAEEHAIEPNLHTQALVQIAPLYPRVYEVWAASMRRANDIEKEGEVYECARRNQLPFTGILSQLEQEYLKLIDHSSISQVITEQTSKHVTELTSGPITSNYTTSHTTNSTGSVHTPEPTTSRKFIHSSPTLTKVGYDKSLLFNGFEEYSFEELRSMDPRYANSKPQTEQIQQIEEDLDQEGDMMLEETNPFEQTAVIPRKSIVPSTPTTFAKNTIDDMFQGEIDCELENNYFEQRKMRKNNNQEDKKRKRTSQIGFSIHEDSSMDKKVKPSIGGSLSTNTKQTDLPQQKTLTNNPTNITIKPRKSSIAPSRLTRGRSLSAFHQFNHDETEESTFVFLEQTENVSQTLHFNPTEPSPSSDNGKLKEDIKRYISNNIVNPFQTEVKNIYSNILNPSNCFGDKRITNCRSSSAPDLNSILNELLKKKKNPNSYDPNNLCIKLSSKTYLVENKISHHILQIQDIRGKESGTSESSLALKFKGPYDLYEYYIADQIQRRVKDVDAHRFLFIQRVYIFEKSTLIIEKLVNNITLQDTLDLGAKFDELLIVYFLSEMLKIIQNLHQAQMLHTCFTPKNLILLNEEGELSDWGINGGRGWDSKGLMLIDYSNSIDTSLFPSNTIYKSNTKPSNTIERFDALNSSGPWKHQIDTFGVCEIVHKLLFKKNMEVTKKQEKFCLKENIKRFWRYKDLWAKTFDELLNTKEPNYGSLISDCENILNERGEAVKGLFLGFIVSMVTKKKEITQ
ncbi:hypothetical protein ABK040_013771 [Willaertia magna]